MDGLNGNTYARGSGGEVSGDTLTLHHNSGYSILTSCGGEWVPGDFVQFKLVGKTISYLVDLSRVGCACNLAFYLVSAPAVDPAGTPSVGKCDKSPYYCDANKVCGQFCPEIDIMEANNHVFQTTPHRCDPPSDSGHYFSCDRNGCGENTRDLPNAYGPGPGFTIDTGRSFRVSTAFEGQGGALSGMVTTLEQEGRQVVLRHAACDPGYLAQVGEAMEPGMSLRITYWGDAAETMDWMDMPPCGEEPCSGSNAGDGIISSISVSPPQEGALSNPFFLPPPPPTQTPVKAPPPTQAPVPAPPSTPAPAPPPTRAPAPPPTRAPAPPTLPSPNPPPSPPSTPAPTTSLSARRPSSDGSPCSPVWQQCGGKHWTGPRCCTSDSHCVHYNDWYAQCVAKPSPSPRSSPAPAAPQPGTAADGGLPVLAAACALNTLKLGLVSVGLYVLAVALLWCFPELGPHSDSRPQCSWISLLPVEPNFLARAGAAACAACASSAATLELRGVQEACEAGERAAPARAEEALHAVRAVNQMIGSVVDRCLCRAEDPP